MLYNHNYNYDSKGPLCFKRAISLGQTLNLHSSKENWTFCIGRVVSVHVLDLVFYCGIYIFLLLLWTLLKRLKRRLIGWRIDFYQTNLLIQQNHIYWSSIFTHMLALLYSLYTS